MATDCKESKEDYELDIELPGCKKENIMAQLKDGYLTVSATTKPETEAKYLRRERRFGTFTRRFYVGNMLTQEDIKAHFEDGILLIDIPKKTARQEEERFIEIEG